MASTQAPAGVPPSGNAKYVGIAIVLLGLIVAAIAWKKCQTPPPPPPPPVLDAGGPVAAGGRDDDVPVPPTIEDAGHDGGKKIVYVQGPGAGCDAKKCAGTTTPELEQTLAFRVKQSHRCYDN